MEPSDRKQEVKRIRREVIVKQLDGDRDRRKNCRRELSNHVVSRWYRSPEVILLDKSYGAPIDMWSMGIILAQMLICI